MNVGIIGAGKIARKMAGTIAMMDAAGMGVKCTAIASRELSRAQEFASANGLAKAYGSYAEMLEDPDIDLVYVATPHSHHFAHASMAIEAGKPVLCEKAFTANAREAEELLDLAHRKGVFITEAIWTRYMPLPRRIIEAIEGGCIGTPYALAASLSYPLTHIPRIMQPELAGGALLDLGVYCLNFARMVFGTDIESFSSQAVIGPTGVDMQESVALKFRGGRLAQLYSGALCRTDSHGLIYGTEGYIDIGNVNIPRSAVIRHSDGSEEVLDTDEWLTGYEFEVLACRDALAAGLIECPQMPHGETLAIMKLMDSLRENWK